jgi:predicted enzyme related to lactoylglutathione lyase
MAITKVQLFSLPVVDQDRSKSFYVDVLGFALIADTSMGPDMRWVQVAPPGSDTSITLVTWFPTMLAGSAKGAVLETDDLEGDLETLKSRGVQIEAEIQEMPWGRFVTFDDPDGNGIVLQTTTK